MPNIFIVNGYHVYIWANENGEPIHVHVSKGKPTLNATKFWITAHGDVLLCHNRSRIPKADLVKISRAIQLNVKSIIIPTWLKLFGQVKFYC